MTVYCGRDFSPADIQTIRDLIAQEPALRRSPLSRRLCELLGWYKPNGELKDMTCRVALLRMHEQGLITLPASRNTRARRRPDFPATPASDAQARLLQPVHELGPLTLRLVSTPPVSRLWNEFVQRYHYLGYTAMSGSQLRYNVYAGDQLVALLSFGASAWKLAARDTFIGWHSAQRLKNLHLVVNNARFLILPWIQCKGLASKILSIVQQGRQLDPRRQDCRSRKEVPRPPADHPHQGHLAVPTEEQLPSHPLRLKPLPAKSADGSTECLPLSGLMQA